MTPLGTALKAARITARMGVRRAAQELGMSQSSLCGIELGQHRPTCRILNAMATAYGVTSTERATLHDLRGTTVRPRSKWSAEHRRNAELAHLRAADTRRSELTAARVAAGLTGTKLASIARGCTPSLLAALETGRESPIRRRDGQWRPVARNIAAALCVPPDELWPDAAPLEPIDYSDDRTIPTPEDIALARDRDRTVRLFLVTLPLKQQRVIHLRFGFTGEAKTLAECGEEFGCFPERVRQIEARALRTLRTRFWRNYRNFDLDEKQS
jgi:RNA polymerase sigma factor (sigma-70 family)